jgi:hypothetical protein
MGRMKVSKYFSRWGLAATVHHKPLPQKPVPAVGPTNRLNPSTRPFLTIAAKMKNDPAPPSEPRIAARCPTRSAVAEPVAGEPPIRRDCSKEQPNQRQALAVRLRDACPQRSGCGGMEPMDPERLLFLLLIGTWLVVLPLYAIFELFRRCLLRWAHRCRHCAKPLPYWSARYCSYCGVPAGETVPLLPRPAETVRPKETPFPSVPLPSQPALPPTVPRRAPAHARAVVEDEQEIQPTALPKPSPAPARRQNLTEALIQYLEEHRIWWGEIAGATLIVAGSIALTISFWKQIRELEVLQVLVFLSVPAFMLASALYTAKRWTTPITTAILASIGQILVPLAYLVLAKTVASPGGAPWLLVPTLLASTALVIFLLYVTTPFCTVVRQPLHIVSLLGPVVPPLLVAACWPNGIPQPVVNSIFAFYIAGPTILALLHMDHLPAQSVRPAEFRKVAFTPLVTLFSTVAAVIASFVQWNRPAGGHIHVLVTLVAAAAFAHTWSCASLKQRHAAALPAVASTTLTAWTLLTVLPTVAALFLNMAHPSAGCAAAFALAAIAAVLGLRTRLPWAAQAAHALVALAVAFGGLALAQGDPSRSRLWNHTAATADKTATTTEESPSRPGPWDHGAAIVDKIARSTLELLFVGAHQAQSGLTRLDSPPLAWRLAIFSLPCALGAVLLGIAVYLARRKMAESTKTRPDLVAFLLDPSLIHADQFLQFFSLAGLVPSLGLLVDALLQSYSASPSWDLPLLRTAPVVAVLGAALLVSGLPRSQHAPWALLCCTRMSGAILLASAATACMSIWIPARLLVRWGTLLGWAVLRAKARSAEGQLAPASLEPHGRTSSRQFQTSELLLLRELDILVSFWRTVATQAAQVASQLRRKASSAPWVAIVPLAMGIHALLDVNFVLRLYHKLSSLAKSPTDWATVSLGPLASATLGQIELLVPLLEPFVYLGIFCTTALAFAYARPALHDHLFLLSSYGVGALLGAGIWLHEEVWDLPVGTRRYIALNWDLFLLATMGWHLAGLIALAVATARRKVDRQQTTYTPEQRDLTLVGLASALVFALLAQLVVAQTVVEDRLGLSEAFGQPLGLWASALSLAIPLVVTLRLRQASIASRFLLVALWVVTTYPLAILQAKYSSDWRLVGAVSVWCFLLLAAACWVSRHEWPENLGASRTDHRFLSWFLVVVPAGVLVLLGCISPGAQPFESKIQLLLSQVFRPLELLLSQVFRRWQGPPPNVVSVGQEPWSVVPPAVGLVAIGLVGASSMRKDVFALAIPLSYLLSTRLTSGWPIDPLSEMALWLLVAVGFSLLLLGLSGPTGSRFLGLRLGPTTPRGGPVAPPAGGSLLWWGALSTVYLQIVLLLHVARDLHDFGPDGRDRGLLSFGGLASGILLAVAILLITAAQPVLRAAWLYSHGLLLTLAAVAYVDAPAGVHRTLLATFGAAYVVIAATVYRAAPEINRLLNRWGLSAMGPRNPAAPSLVIVVGSLATSLGVLGAALYATLTISPGGENPILAQSLRTVAAHAAILPLAGLALLSSTPWRPIIQNWVVGLLPLSLSVWFQMYIDPETSTLENRLGAVILAFGLVTTLLGQTVHRWAHRIGDWLDAATRAAPVLAVVTILITLALFLIAAANQPQWPLRSPALEGPFAVYGTLAGLGLAGFLFLIVALVPGRDPFGWTEKQKSAYIYGFELTTGLMAVVLYFAHPDLFEGVIRQYWPLIALGISFVGAGLGEVARRRSVVPMAEALHHTNILLPVLTLVGCFFGWTADVPVLRTEVDYSLAATLAAIFYVVVSSLRHNYSLAVWASIAVTTAIWWYMGKHIGWTPRERLSLWMWPIALGLLAATEYHRGQLDRMQRAAVRYSCLSLGYLSSTADVFVLSAELNWWMPLVLLTLALAGLFIGLAFRIQSYTACGILFFALSTVGIVHTAARVFEWTWLWYLYAILLGVVLLVIFGAIEQRRPRLQSWVAQVRTWDWQARRSRPAGGHLRGNRSATKADSVDSATPSPWAGSLPSDAPRTPGCQPALPGRMDSELQGCRIREGGSLAEETIEPYVWPRKASKPDELWACPLQPTPCQRRRHSHSPGPTQRSVRKFHLTPPR